MAFLTDSSSNNISVSPYYELGYADPVYDLSVKKFGASSIVFNGQNYLIADANSVFSLGNVFTIHMWILHETGMSFQTAGLLTNADGGGTNWRMTWENGRLATYFNDVNQYTVHNDAFPDYAFQHLALCRNNSNWYLFYDGVLKKSWTNATTYSFSDRPLRIAYYYPGINKYRGRIDELEIINGACLWTTNFTPPISANAAPDANTDFLMHFDKTFFKIKGTLSEEAKVYVIDQSDDSLESVTTESAGAYEVEVGESAKTIIAKSTTTGQVIGYGDVNPIEE